MASIKDALGAMQGRRVLVVGDVMLDEFIYGSVDRSSPESGSPVLLQQDRKYMPGGAANVAMNVAALGGHCHLVGLCGEDAAAVNLCDKLSEWVNIKPGIVKSSRWQTTTKIRFVNRQNNAHILRLDRELTGKLHTEIIVDLENRVNEALSQVDIVILSDYQKGTLQPSLIRTILDKAARTQTPVIVDPKGQDFSKYRGATLICPNLDELSLAVSRSLIQDDRDVESAAVSLVKHLNYEAVCVKRSEAGVQLVRAVGTTARHLSRASRVVDVAGAGDTLVATLAMTVASGAGLELATCMANAAAGIAVSKEGVAHVKVEELTASLSQPQWRRKVYDTYSSLGKLVQSWKQAGLTVGFTNGCFDLLHSGHTSTLEQARSQVDRLILAINSDESVQRLKGPLRPVQDQASRVAVAAAIEHVDAVIVFGEDTPLKLITELQPHKIFKGGDYEPCDVVGYDLVKSYGGQVVITPFEPGTSTTNIIDRVQRNRIDSCAPTTSQPTTPLGFGLPNESIASLQYSDTLADAVDDAFGWLLNSAWPFWLKHGLAKDENDVAYAFHEHLNHDTPHCTANRRRLVVVARQTYVFSEAMAAGISGAQEAVALGISLLRNQARSSQTGRYRSHFNIDGSAVSGENEVYSLYDHAFVLLAFASAMKVSPCEELRKDATALNMRIQSDFAHPNGGFYETLPTSPDRRHDAHMHLFEAYIAATEAFGPSPFLERADYLASFFFEHLWHEAEGVVPENFNDCLHPVYDTGRFAVEPGHLAEWVRLLLWYKEVNTKLGRQPEVDEAQAESKLIHFYEHYGLDQSTGALVDGLWSDGTAKTGSQRLWPQTERLQAELLRGDATEEKILEAFRVLKAYISSAPDGLWMERRLADGSFGEEPSPASSLYHLTAAITKAHRVIVTLKGKESGRLPTRVVNRHAPSSDGGSVHSRQCDTLAPTADAASQYIGSAGSSASALSSSEKASMPLIVVTGGAGFIGSNIVAALNEAGNDNVVVCDDLGSSGKWQNLAKRTVANVIPPSDLMAWLEDRNDVEAIIHMGADSSTAASDGDHIMECNFRYSIRLLDWCTKHKVKLIYASSAATYGDGSQGFEDDSSSAYLKKLRPLNLYGWSKHLFDKVVATRREAGGELPPVCIGLKFFNVFGPNEYHKDNMASLVTQHFPRIVAGENVKLFRSHRPDFGDGKQLRDFVYVHDATDIVLWLLEHAPHGAALYNVGTGQAKSFLDLANASFDALGLKRRIEFVDMPADMQPRYQYLTQAAGARLRDIGYGRPYMTLQDSVAHFVKRYLNTENRYR